jgi:hypothetical protein
MDATIKPVSIHLLMTREINILEAHGLYEKNLSTAKAKRSIK